VRLQKVLCLVLIFLVNLIKQSIIISIIPGSIQCSCVVTSPKFQGASFIMSLVSLRPDQPYWSMMISMFISINNSWFHSL
jgi:hypothetical protein